MVLLALFFVLVIGGTHLNMRVDLLQRVSVEELASGDWRGKNGVTLVPVEVLFPVVVAAELVVVVELGGGEPAGVEVGDVLVGLGVVHELGLDGKVLGGALRGRALHVVGSENGLIQRNCSAVKRRVLRNGGLVARDFLDDLAGREEKAALLVEGDL